MPLKQEAYRYFFSMGIFAALIGIVLWMLFPLNLLSFYPRQAHANIMFFVFLWSFVAGFLMTAVPKMTSSPPANAREKSLLIVILLCSLVGSLWLSTNVVVGLFILQNIFLMFFLGRRFFYARRIPFSGFIFIPFAFLNIFIGSSLFFLFQNHQWLYLFCGEAFILNLILGIGSRLIPVISRISGALMPTEKENSSDLAVNVMLALFLNISFFVQAFGNFYWAIALRMLVVLWLSIVSFQVFRKMTSRSILGWGIKVAILLMLASYGVLFIKGEATALVAQHLLYIGCFMLITLMISTRVVLAHGKGDLDAEIHSKSILLVFVLSLLATLARYIAAYNIISLWMLSAALFAILAFIFWIYTFIKNTFRYEN